MFIRGEVEDAPSHSSPAVLEAAVIGIPLSRVGVSRSKPVFVLKNRTGQPTGSFKKSALTTFTCRLQNSAADSK